MFGCGGGMKKSSSELNLEALLWSDDTPEIKDPRFGDSPIRSPDMLSGVSSGDGQAEAFFWSHNLTQKHSCISPTIDSQSSLCVGSPTWAHKPKSEDNQARSDSSHEQSDDEDAETEAGPCVQSTDPKRLRRMVLNRESARRSRRRKQAHLQELESEVENLVEEKAALSKLLADASEHFRDSFTCYCVLKSDVDALRAKVKLAEEMIAQGSLTSSFNQLLQNHLSSPQLLNPLDPWQLPNVSPAATVHGDDASFVGTAVSGQNLALGLENSDANNVGVNSGVMSDAVSCVTGMWPEEFVSTLSK